MALSQRFANAAAVARHDGGMNVTDAVKLRYSVRGYTEDPVPEELIREVLDVVRLAPSNSNTQPWHIAVVSGATRAALEAALCAASDAGTEPNRDFVAAAGAVDGVYRDRRRACGFSYYETMGVSREDRAGRAAIARKNYEFFGAPHVAFLSMPKTMSHASAVDMGIFLQTLMLVFAERGIGCIPQGALGNYPDIVRAQVSIPEGNGILCGISFGWEDKGAHINTVRMPREPVAVISSFSS